MSACTAALCTPLDRQLSNFATSQSDLRSATLQIIRTQFGGLGKKYVMILPKLALIVGAARCFRRPLCLWMNTFQWEVSEDQPYPFRIFFQHLSQGWMHLLAEGTMKIRELDDSTPAPSRLP